MAVDAAGVGNVVRNSALFTTIQKLVQRHLLPKKRTTKLAALGNPAIQEIPIALVDIIAIVNHVNIFYALQIFSYDDVIFLTLLFYSEAYNLENHVFLIVLSFHHLSHAV